MTSAATSGAVVALDHVTKRYGPDGTPAAVTDLSLTIPAGEVCVLVGPSGCGKTTTMKMINRLVEPTSGRVTIDGDDVAALPPVVLRRRIGYVIQQVGLFPHMTVGENTAVVPRLLRWPAARIRDRVDELLDLVGLEPGGYRDRYPSELSGGERHHVLAIDRDSTAGRLDQPVDHLHGGRLAASRGADQHADSAGRHGQAEPVDSRGRSRRSIALRHVLERDDGAAAAGLLSGHSLMIRGRVTPPVVGSSARRQIRMPSRS